MLKKNTNLRANCKVKPRNYFMVTDLSNTLKK